MNFPLLITLRHEEMTAAVFPRECESLIEKEELKGRISIQDENHPQG